MPLFTTFFSSSREPTPNDSLPQKALDEEATASSRDLKNFFSQRKSRPEVKKTPEEPSRAQKALSKLLGSNPPSRPKKNPERRSKVPFLPRKPSVRPAPRHDRRASDDDAASTHSRTSRTSVAKSQRSRRSRGSLRSWRSGKSHVSRVSRMSGSSQRSYENPVLESVQTIVESVTKLEAAARSRVVGGRVVGGRVVGGGGDGGHGKGKGIEKGSATVRYLRALRELREQAEGYTNHHKVVLSDVHTSPKELVSLSNRIRILEYDIRQVTGDFGVHMDAEMLENIRAEMEAWFDTFLAEDSKPEQHRPANWVPVPSPLKHEIPSEAGSKIGETPRSVGGNDDDSKPIITIDLEDLRLCQDPEAPPTHPLEDIPGGSGSIQPASVGQ
ncbi:hypothetical protein B0J18DRAFT_213482 [Chaetomium sp. MPI-SDFR-AT-0129]|nr:hypothetical protein B0J18DRAFT_213482 [Chaetomium sp. MPI-SDFR-AT-0129]